MAQTKFTTALAFVAFAALVAGYFLFIHHWAVNSIFWDQWWDVQLLSHWYSGKLTLSELWAQHGENRVFFPNLVVLLLARTVRFNTVFEVYLSGVLMTISTAAILLAHKLRSPSINWLWYLPIAALMMSLVQFGDMLWGFQLAWYMVYFSLALSLFLLDRPRLTWIVLGVALVVATVGSYSSIQGLLIWPVGLWLLYQRNRSHRMSLTWLGFGVVVGFVYFYNLNLQGASFYALRHPVATAKFFFVLMGDVLGLGVPPAPNAGTYAIMALGVVIFLVACWVVIAVGRHRDDASGAPLGVAITAYGLLFTMMTACFRVDQGLNGAGSSHYMTFTLLVIVGCCLTLLSVWEPLDERVRRWRAKVVVVMGYMPKAVADEPHRVFTSRVCQSSRPRTVPWMVTPLVGGIIALQLLVGTVMGSQGGWWWSVVLKTAANATVNGNQWTRTYQINSLVPGCQCPNLIAMIPGLIRVMRVHHLSMFGTADAAMYAKDGYTWPYGQVVPTTRIILPSPGARLSGLVQLDASASDENGIVKVDYVVSGDGRNDVTISRAKGSLYGWLGAWNTSTVSNGNYELRTVARNVTGKSWYSRAVPVMVDNP
jgi:hypothetical protein